MPIKPHEEDAATPPNPLDYGRQWVEMAVKAQQAMAAALQNFSAKDAQLPSVIGRDALGAYSQMASSFLNNPAALNAAQMDLWQRQAALWQELTQPKAAGQEAPARPDRRFKNEQWENNPALHALMRSYLVGADWLRSLVERADLDPAAKRKATFFTEQFIDASAPTNFALTNPDVVSKAIETKGASLVQGYSNFLDDVLKNAGHVRRADQEAFELGVNIAATKGSVVLRTPMMELIQYEPTTPKVKAVPILLISPWVNKYYLFDLQQKTSFIKWAVDQGLTVFAISWVNPDASLAEKDFGDYWLEGPQAAFDAIARATGQDKVNLIGYCLGGTLTVTGLAYLAARDDHRVNSATLIATMTDFADFGDFEALISKDSVALLKEQLADTGYISDADLSRVFSLLRANDLIWSSAISSYLLADEAVPSDLLYWFSDGIGMPAKMVDTFLRELILNNALARKGALKVNGTPIDLKAVKTPLCFVSLKADHVSHWEETYRGALRFTAPKRFILGGSGHNAGVINPPAANKHGYWLNEDMPTDPQAWLAGAERHEGSWWGEWLGWLKKKSGKDVAARPVAGGPLPVMEAAPGSYAKTRR